MIRPTEEAEIRAEEWLPEDDAAREYEELAEMEALGASEAEPWSVASAAEALSDLEGELELVGELEARPDWALRLAEKETTEDRVTRRFEGIDLDEIDALAHYRDEAESRALPDDEIQRESEAIAT
jgi:hypothetical protein